MNDDVNIGCEVIHTGDREIFRGKKFSVDDGFFDVMSDEQYWALGLYASDGSVHNNQIYISQSGDDGLRRVLFLRSLLKSEYPIRSAEPKIGKTAYSLIFSSKKIVSIFEEYGIVENKTKIFTLPDIPERFLPAFISGYVEGDGCITIINASHSKILMASFVGTKEFVEECSKRIPIKGKIRKHSMSDICEIRWYSKHAVQFCEWMYSCGVIYRSYKYDNYLIGKDLYESSRDVRFGRLKEEIINDFNNGVISTVREAIDKYKIKNKTLAYKWFCSWYKSGLLNRDYHIKKGECQ